MNHKTGDALGAEAWLQQGYDACMQGDPETAIRAFEHSLSLEPLVEITRLMALNNLGSLLSQRGDVERAFDCYDRVIHYHLYPDPAIREQVALAQHNKGLALRGSGDFSKAIACFDEIIRNHRQNNPQVDMRGHRADAYVAKVYCLLSADDAEQALVCYDELLQEHADAATAELESAIAATLYNQGVRAKELGDSVRLHDCYERLIQRFRESSYPDVQFVLACALNNQSASFVSAGEYERALDSFRQVVRDFSRWEDPRLQDQVRHAASTIGALLNAMAFDCIMEAKQAWDAKEQRQILLQRALGILQEALRENMTQPCLAEGNKAYAHWLLGNAEEAQTLLLSALRQGGEDLRDIELEDSETFQVSCDPGFRELVWACWEKVQAA